MNQKNICTTICTSTMTRYFWTDNFARSCERASTFLAVDFARGQALGASQRKGFLATEMMTIRHDDVNVNSDDNDDNDNDNDGS